MLPAAGEPNCRNRHSLKVFAQVVVVALPHHCCGHARVVWTTRTSAGIEAFPVDDDVFSNGLFPRAESLLMARNVGVGVDDDVFAMVPHASRFAGQCLGDDRS